MSKKKRTKKDSFLSWFIFFVTVAVPITVSLAVFVYVNRESGGNTTALAITMLIVIVLLTALFAHLRRGFWVPSRAETLDSGLPPSPHLMGYLKQRG